MAKNKNTIQKEAKQSINNIAANAGLLLMTAAATTLMLEVPDTPSKRAVLAPQPVFAAPGSSLNGELKSGNEMRREREETGPHYISYGVSQRTPGRTGKI